jgi:hypothetical protein
MRNAMLFLRRQSVHARLRSLHLGYPSPPLLRGSYGLERGFRGTNEGSSVCRAARNHDDCSGADKQTSDSQSNVLLLLINHSAMTSN